MSLPSAVQPQPDAMPRPVPPPQPSAYALLRRRLGYAALAVALLCALISPFPLSAWPDIALLTALAIGVSFLAVRLPSSDLTTYPGIPIIFALVALHGAFAAIVAAIIPVLSDGFLSLPRTRRFQVKYYVPNVSMQVATVGGSALIYVVCEKLCFPKNGVQLGETPSWGPWVLLPLCSLLTFISGALITATLVSTYQKKRWDVTWHNNYRWQIVSGFLMAPVGLLTAILYGENKWLGLGFVVLPVYALRAAVLTYEKRLLIYKQGVELMGRVMQEAHPYTHGHLHRVSRWAVQIAEDIKLPPASMQYIEDAALLHDIGKVAVDDRILNKIGKLNDDDWNMIRRHPVTGADLVAQMTVLGTVSHWIRHHHERPDGKGYPDGLQSDGIPLESSIISVVDAFDAMVGGPAKEDQRPYRQPMSRDSAISELRRHSGTQFHAEVVEAFVAILQREHALEAAGLPIEPRPGIADDSLWAAAPESLPALSLSSMS